jgi:hypothetical protein
MSNDCPKKAVILNVLTKNPACRFRNFDFVADLASRMDLLRTGQILREYTALNGVGVLAKMQSDACGYAGHGLVARTTFFIVRWWGQMVA